MRYTLRFLFGHWKFGEETQADRDSARRFAEVTTRLWIVLGLLLAVAAVASRHPQYLVGSVLMVLGGIKLMAICWRVFDD
jgi:hypothetical protein